MNSREERGFYKLSLMQRIGFGSGDLAQNLIYNTVSTYLLFFYTNVYGLNPAHVAIMFLLVRVIDAFSDPITGAFMDKFNAPWGRYRSYLVIAGIPMSILSILVFFTGFSPSLAYAYISYIVLTLLYTAVNIPYGALNASLTRDTDEITKLTATRMFFANIGGLIVAYGVPVLVKFFSSDGQWDNPASGGGWMLTMSIYALVGALILIFCFSQTRERVVMDKEEQDKVRVTDLFVEIKNNGPLRILTVFFIVAFAMMSIGNAAGAYYMQYNVNASDKVQYFNALGSLPAFIFMPMIPAIKRKMGKKNMLLFFLGIAVIGMIWLFLIPDGAGSIVSVYIAQFIKSTGVIVATGYMWSLIPEVISYGEYISGKRVSGIVNALIGFFFKFGMALGGVVPGFVLGITNFNAALMNQPESALFGIKLLVTVIPAILLVVLMIIISMYKLTDEKVEQINREIENRKLKTT